MPEDKDYRDAGTGRFVTDEYAEANPATTYGTAKHPGLPVAGYKSQSQDKVDLVNGFKQDEERILRKIGRLQKNIVGTYDQRMLAKAFTEIQDAFMWLNRAVFQPGRIDLPEDDLDLARRNGYATAENFQDSPGGPKAQNPYPAGTKIHDSFNEGIEVWQEGNEPAAA